MFGCLLPNQRLSKHTAVNRYLLTVLTTIHVKLKLSVSEELATPENSQKTIFIGESVMVWAKVLSGYNLTFHWSFCGEVKRVYEFDRQDPFCQLTQCKENFQVCDLQNILRPDFYHVNTLRRNAQAIYD